MFTAECAKILWRYNEMRLTSNDQRRRPSPTPKYRGSGLKRKYDSYCSFRVFAESNLDRLLDSSVWPTGVLVRDFI